MNEKNYWLNKNGILEDKKGTFVFRNIRGHRIRIHTKENLGNAMINSGKFKENGQYPKRETIRIEKDKLSKFENKKTKIEQDKKNHYLRIQSNKIKRNEIEIQDNRAEKNKINENAPIRIDKNKRILQNYDKYSETDKHELMHETIQKKINDFKKRKGK